MTAFQRATLDPQRSPQRGLKGLLKRSFDVAAVLMTAPLTVPLVAGISATIRLTMGSPVLFRQRRTGYLGQPFDILKFRTMRPPTDNRDPVSTDGARTTRLGRMLRRASLDELPSLWNVIRGELSLVGPRPFIDDYRPLYNERQYSRHVCRPGLTGLAQVEGRNLLGWDERFELDLQYARDWRFRDDLLLLARTLGRVVAASGVDNAEGVTMYRFEGGTEDGRGCTN